MKSSNHTQDNQLAYRPQFMLKYAYFGIFAMGIAVFIIYKGACGLGLIGDINLF